MAEKGKHSSWDFVGDTMQYVGLALQGKLPGPEKLATPGMKKIAKSLGELTIFGWNRPNKK